MPSLSDRVLFSEPAGRPNNLVHFAGALSLFGVYMYIWSVGKAGGSNWLLGMAAANAVAGVADSLPTNRRQVAGILRLVAISVLLCLVAAAIVVPELVRSRSD